MQGFELLCLPFGAQIPIILLVESVKLAQLCVVGVERSSQGIGQTLLECSAEEPASLLDPFNGAGRKFWGFQRLVCRGHQYTSFT
jgi:hypothetical protein